MNMKWGVLVEDDKAEQRMRNLLSMRREMRNVKKSKQKQKNSNMLVFWLMCVVAGLSLAGCFCLFLDNFPSSRAQMVFGNLSSVRMLL